MPFAPTRRAVLALAASSLPLAVAGVPAHAAPTHAGPAPRVAALIRQARRLPRMSERIALISRGLLGRPYLSNTLIGGPDRPERFVVRDDAFDCVTFCEVVLAAARAQDRSDFEATLRRVRYANDRIAWDDRNHYFAEWCRHAVEKQICAPVALPSAEHIRKTVNWFPQGRREVDITAVPREALRAGRDRLVAGDIVGFVSRRSNLDFYHTGFVMFGADGQWLLRHASQRQRRVVDEPMEAFLAVNGVRHVSLLRPLPARAGATV